ncbi:MAG: lysylphosphatidylglycerol synthase transmembrane domain-containing protein [Acidimicrobiia bacterium]
MADPDDLGRRPRKVELARWIAGLVIGGLSVWVAFAVAGGLSDAADALRQLSTGWLLAGFGIEALSYLVLGVKLRQLIGPEVVGNVESVELGLVLSGFGLLTPARPAEGLALVASHLRHRGISKRSITMAFGFSEWFSTRVFLLLSAINLIAVALIERDPISELWPLLLAAVVVPLLLAATARMAARSTAAERLGQLVGALRRPTRRRPVEERRAAAAAWHHDAKQFIGSPRHRAGIAVLTAAASLADVACLWCALRAAGGDVGFDVAMLAVTVAAVSSLIPLIPGGLGIVEAAIPAVAHHYGVPYEQGLAAAVAYRVLGTFIPAGVGAMAIVGLRRYAAPSGPGNMPR